MAPRKLTEEERTMLRAALFTPAQIAQYEAGTLAPSIVTKVDRVRANGGSFGYGGIAEGFTSGVSQAHPTNPTPPLPSPKPRTQAGYPSGWKPGGSIGSSIGSAIGSGLAGLSDILKPSTKTKPTSGNAKLTEKPGKPGGGSVSPYQIDTSTMPEAPGAYEFTVPQISMRDFSEQARQMAADAFAPFLQGFDIARTNAQAQGKTSKEATAGMYDQFVKDIAAKAAETAGRYDQVKAETAQRTNAQQADIAQNQQSANQDVGNQLASLGLEASAPTMLQYGANNQAQAQNAAGAVGEEGQQYYDQQKLSQGDYDSQYGNLMQKAGIGAQQDMDMALNNTLTGIDINKANAQGQQSTTALDLAQQLANRDLQMQQANAGYDMQGQQLNYGAIQDQYKNQMGAWEAVTNAGQQNWTNNFDWTKFNADQAYRYDQLGLEADAAAAQGSNVPAPKASDYPQGNRAAWILKQNNIPDNVYNDMLSSMDTFLRSQDIKTTDTPQTKAFKFALWWQQQAATSGLPAAAMSQAARAMMEDYYGGNEDLRGVVEGEPQEPALSTSRGYNPGPSFGG